VAGLLADGIRLPLVLGHAGVDVLDDIRPDRGAEDLGKDLSGAGGLAIGAENSDGRARGHLVQCWDKSRRAATRDPRVSKTACFGSSFENPRFLVRKSCEGFEGTAVRADGCAYLGVGRFSEDREKSRPAALQLKFCNISWRCASWGLLGASTGPNPR